MELAAIILLNIFLYFQTLNYNVIVDDARTYGNYAKKGGVKISAGLIKFLQSRLYGACTFGTNIHLDHIVTTTLFTSICVLIYFAFGHNITAFWAAILFACNPLNNQISMWLNGRRYAVNIILVLSMMLLGAWGILLYPATMLFQVTAIFAPVLLMGKSPWFLLAIPAVFLLAKDKIGKKILSRIRMINDADRREFHPKRFIIITKQYGHYFFKMIFPGRCGMMYPKLYYWGITEDGNKNAYAFNWDFAQGVLAIVLSIAGCILLPEELRPYAIFASLATLQWCAIIPVVQDLSDRYASMPNVFMMFFVSYLVNTYVPNFATVILTGFAIYYACNLFVVMRMYRNFGSYWEYQRFYFPEVPSPRKYEIQFYIKQEKLDKAWTLISEGLHYNPNEYILLVYAAQVNEAIGKIDVARDYIKRAMQNYNIGQKDIQAPFLEGYLARLSPNREQRRAQSKADRGSK